MSMSLHFQAAYLVDSPSYPNAIAWSDENLVAVASGHLVTILNPATPSASRGLITIPASKPFSIGVIERKDLLSGCLVPTSLSRNVDPCVRSISWSPVGLAPNAGCLLAVCTTQGRVKIYRMPFCEFSAEWIEVVDVSDRLHAYLTDLDFEDSISAFVDQLNQVADDQNSADDVPISVLSKCKRRRHSTLTAVKNKTDRLNENTLPHVALSNMRSRALKTVPDSELPLISAQQYAYRIAMLSSLVVSWSPIVRLSADFGGGSSNNSSNDCSILAIGTKSGRIIFWRVHGPRCYSIMDSGKSITASPVGFVQAHCSWITAVSWASFVSDASNSQLLLATGSSDGSVKIWRAGIVELLKSSEFCHAPLSFLKEIMNVDSVPVSALALTIPAKAPNKFHLAIGKGSGLIEAWICDMLNNKFEKAGTYDAHDHVVTGLAWAYDGNCLYSCSQDNSLRSWTLHGNFLCEASIPSNTPDVKTSTDVPHIFDSCYGVAFSPGNLVIAVARSFDTELLNPMYQQRALKACIEFQWVGGQLLDNSPGSCLDLDVESFPGLPVKEIINWESNVIWSLNYHEHLDRPLVIWDVVAALLAFKRSIPKYVERILLNWLRSYTRESLDSSATILSDISKSLSKLSSRQLNLINIISRHVVLEERKADKINVKQSDADEIANAEEEELNLWRELIVNCEIELQLRLVGRTFSTILSSLLSESSAACCERGFWIPAGLAQMEQWVSLNKKHVPDNIKLLVEDIRNVEKRHLHSVCEYVVEEQCSFCSALVPFESAEVAFCEGVKGSIGVGDRHKLARCSVSMQVCPATPSWYCVSCQRRSVELAPKTFFSMHRYPSDSEASISSRDLEDSTKPFCPFCGILLQRPLPEFLLSASPI